MQELQTILCRGVLRVIADVDADGGALDRLDIHWHEQGRRALRRQSRGGLLVRVILPAGQVLEHGSVLGDDLHPMILVNVLACAALVIRPSTPERLAEISYAVGNLHLPAEIREGQIVIPATEAAEAALGRAGIVYGLETRRVRPRLEDLPRIALGDGMVVTRSDAGPPVRS